MILSLLPFTVRYKHIFKFIPHVNKRSAMTLSFKIFGEHDIDANPPILLLHGLFGNKKHWNSIGKTIVTVTKRSVVAIDLRNHGDSPHANSHKYEDMAQDILDMLTKLSIKRATLIGQSMGGKAAICVALLKPEKVSGLLVIDISPVSKTKQIADHYPKILMTMKEINFNNAKFVSLAQKEARKKLKDIIFDEHLMRAVLANVKQRNKTIRWGCNIDVLLKDIEYIASFPKELQKLQFHGPTLFIGGQLSEFLPPEDLNEIREMFPSSVITYVPNTGHNLHVEDPITFLSLAITFIKSNK